MVSVRAASDAPAHTRDRLANVQIMRALAAAMVVVHHVEDLAVSQTPGFAVFRPVPLAYGVDLFFVISGFIIALTSREIVLRRATGRFVGRRLLRIVPLYWICLSLWIAMTACKGAVTGESAMTNLLTADNILASYLFIPADTRGYGEAYPYPLLVLGWTLNYELFFYAIFALCIPFGERRFYPLLLTIFAALILLGQTIPDMGLPFSFWTKPLIIEFLAGMGLASLRAREVRIGRAGQILLIGAGLAVWILLPQSTFGPVPDGAKGSYSWPRLLSGGTGAVLIVGAACLAREQWRGAMARCGQALGDSSYSVYLTHTMTLAAAGTVVGLSAGVLNWSWPLVCLIILLAIAAGHIFYLTVEYPLLLRFRCWLEGANAEPTPAL